MKNEQIIFEITAFFDILKRKLEAGECLLEHEELGLEACYMELVRMERGL
jgi:hypothetical protein